MNKTYNINQGLSRSFLRAGIVIIIVVLALLVMNTIRGYGRVHKLRTLDNCKVYTSVETAGELISHPSWKLKIVQQNTDTEEWETVFESYVRHGFYQGFEEYDLSDVTFYETGWGQIFPVCRLNCSDKEAEREYRKMNPPILWYFFYWMGFVSGVICCCIGSSGRDPAKNYIDNTVYEVPVNFEDM